MIRCCKTVEEISSTDLSLVKRSLWSIKLFSLSFNFFLSCVTVRIAIDKTFYAIVTVVSRYYELGCAFYSQQ